MSEERSEEEIMAIAKEFVGMEIKPSIYRIRGKSLDMYAKAVGATNPKYFGKKVEGEKKPDYSETVAHPTFAAYYTIPGLFNLADLKGEDGQPLIKNIGKLLHTGQFYDYSGCEPLTQAAGKIYTGGVIKDICIKSGILWLSCELTTTDKDKKITYCKTTVSAGIRKGGY